jgi:hypothetical protein
MYMLYCSICSIVLHFHQYTAGGGKKGTGKKGNGKKVQVKKVMVKRYW